MWNLNIISVICRIIISGLPEKATEYLVDEFGRYIGCCDEDFCGLHNITSNQSQWDELG